MTPPTLDELMTPPTLDELMKLAEAATPGPWVLDTDYDIYTTAPSVVEDGNGSSIILSIPYMHPDGEYIAAANPDTVLKILRDYKRMRDFLERLELTMPFRGHFNHDCDCEAHNARACLAALEMGKGGE